MKFLLLAAISLVTLYSLHAQAPQPAVDASRLSETTQPKTPPSLSESAGLSQRSIDEETAFAPETPGDNDIGDQLILKQVPKNSPFRFSADSFIFWTDNAARTSAGELEDYFYGGRAAVSYQPKITNRLFADVTLSEDVFRYEAIEALNFEAVEASASLLYSVPQLADAVVFGGYAFSHITQDFEALLTSHSARAGIQKNFLIDRRNSLSLSLMGDWDIDTDVSALMRDEYSGTVGWRFKLMSDLHLNLSYRYTWFDYTDFGRRDSLHSASFGINYTPRQWCEIYLSLTYGFNDSNFAVYDYEATNLGGGLGVRLKF